MKYVQAFYELLHCGVTINIILVTELEEHLSNEPLPHEETHHKQRHGNETLVAQ